MATGVCVWWMMFHIRVSHAGKVCSGDYLSSNDSTEGYLKDSGDFIIFFLYLIKGSLTIIACYTYWLVFTELNLSNAFDRRPNPDTQKAFMISTIFFAVVLWWIYSLPGLGGPVMFLIVVLYLILFKIFGYVPLDPGHAGMEWGNHG